MSDEWEERRERERQEAIALEREKIASAREIESRKMDVEERAQAIRYHDWHSYPERLRAQRHHDVLCLVLKESMRAVSSDVSKELMNVEDLLTVARNIADLAYPPPKAEGT